MSPTQRFLWGAFGAFAVEFIRLWKLRDNKIGRPISYYALSVGMAVISGVWTVAVANETQAVAQISVGISAPVALSALAAGRGLPDSNTSPGPGSSATDATGSVMTTGSDQSPSPTPSRILRFYLRGLFR